MNPYQLSLAMSSASVQITELQMQRSMLTEELLSVRHVLERTLKLCGEKDRTITFLTAEDATKGQQIVALRRDSESLRRDHTGATSKIAELQHRLAALSAELSSVRGELETRVSSAEENDLSTAILNSNIEEWKRADAAKAEQLDTERREKKALQRDIAVVSSRIADSQERYDVQSKEVVSLRNELQIKMELLAKQEHIIDSVRAELRERILAEEKDRTNTSLRASVEGLQHVNATNAKQLEAEREEEPQRDIAVDSESLRGNLSSAISEIAELQQRLAARSAELNSVRGQLEISVSSIKEKDRSIASLNADIEEWKRSSRIADPQERYDIHWKEVVSLRNELQIKMALLAEQEYTIDSVRAELEERRTLAEEKDRTITSLRASVEELQDEDTIKVEQLYDSQASTFGIDAFQQWMSKGSIDADKLISDGDPSISPSDVHNVFVHNALLEARSRNWCTVYQDAEKSIDIRPSAMGYVAKALAQASNGELEESMRVFDLAFGNCNLHESTLLLLSKAIILFLAGKYCNAVLRVHDLIDTLRDDEAVYCCTQVLGRMYMEQGDYAHALELLEQGRSFAMSCTGRHLETISLDKIFGWTFDSLQVTAQLYHSEALLAAGRTEDAAEVLSKMLDAFGKEMNEVTTKRAMDLKKKCTEGLQELGYAAFRSGKLEEATARYSTALSLGPANPIDILVERSRVLALQELWQDALEDADEVIKLDASSHRGYERKCMALYGAKKYAEGAAVLRRMLSIIWKSKDEKIHALQENYIHPDEATKNIDTAIREIFRLCPLVLIDLETGQLCDAHERIRLFKSETPYEKLVLEIGITKLDYPRIRQAVAKYFRWAMFSHMWQPERGREPTFQDVNVVDSVWNLGQSPLDEKLRQFCSTSRKDGHRWAWSDTCCIDKSTSTVLNKSLTLMYNWYEEAAETVVYLADVLPSAEPGDLTKSRWMRRAWTLQELLASKVVRFYNCEWKLYLDDKNLNHKESPVIKTELAQAMGVAPETVTSFHPTKLGVREKLRLASEREATEVEDIAYSLIGIFSSNIRTQYGLGKTALGELLENIVDRTGDVGVIAWTGKSLPYNSALPDSLAVYNQTPHTPPPMEANNLDTRVEELRAGSVSEEYAVRLYNQVVQLPRATFFNRRLRLPCILFPVTSFKQKEINAIQGHLYQATVSSLGKVEFRTKDSMPSKVSGQKPRTLVFVHPWLYDLCDSLDGPKSDDEPGAVSEVNLGAEPEAEPVVVPDSDDGTDASSVPTSPSDFEPPVQPYTQALRLIARLGRPFNALLLKQQPHNQYKRVAAESEIIVQANCAMKPEDLRAEVLEII